MANQPNAQTALGRRLRSVRESKGWSRETLARKSGTASLTLLRVELHGVDPNLGTLRAWADALEVPVADLLADEGAIEVAP